MFGATLLAVALATDVLDVCQEHTGVGRYGDNCVETAAGGYCLSTGLSWAVDGTAAVCTSFGA